MSKMGAYGTAAKICRLINFNERNDDPPTKCVSSLLGLSVVSTYEDCAAHSLKLTISLAKVLEKLNASVMKKGHCQVQSTIINLTMKTLAE